MWSSLGEVTLTYSSAVQRLDPAPSLRDPQAVEDEATTRLDGMSAVPTDGDVPHLGEGLDDRAGRRARCAIRRYVRHNDLPSLLTLTVAPEHYVDDVGHLRARLRKTTDRVQRLYGPLPVLAVVERGKRGTKRLHLHLGVANDERLHEAFREAWPYGFTGTPSSWDRTRASAQGAARYLEKYVAKDPMRVGFGTSRYFKTRGHEPPVHRARFAEGARALEVLREVTGGVLPAHEWCSDEDPDWQGPPVRSMRWE